MVETEPYATRASTKKAALKHVLKVVLEYDDNDDDPLPTMIRDEGYRSIEDLLVESDGSIDQMTWKDPQENGAKKDLPKFSKAHLKILLNSYY